MTPDNAEAPRSWVANLDEASAHQREVDALLGRATTAVRYVNIDYRQIERTGTAAGARWVSSSNEWSEPTQLFPSCHSVDFGVELEFGTDVTLSVTWESPGRHEGLAVYEGPLAGMAVRDDANRAVWDVTEWGPWADAVGEPITRADLRYKPWGEDDGYWCECATITFGLLRVSFVLGQGNAEASVARPSVNNVAVLFPEHPRPDWLSE